jgi:hypothetical protein
VNAARATTAARREDRARARGTRCIRSPYNVGGTPPPIGTGPGHARTTPQHSAPQSIVNPGYMADSGRHRERMNVRNSALVLSAASRPSVYSEESLGCRRIRADMRSLVQRAVPRDDTGSGAALGRALFLIRRCQVANIGSRFNEVELSRGTTPRLPLAPDLLLPPGEEPKVM